jgi:MFS family permease
VIDQPGGAAEIAAGDGDGPVVQASAFEVFGNRPFLLLWLSQAFTQIGANMVMYGLTVLIVQSGSPSTAVSVLILTFLGPAVVFSAVAGVFVDRVDRRTILVVTNVLRGGAFVLTFLSGGFLPAILLLSMIVSTITVFFAPAEAAMIPVLVPRGQLMAANGVFTLTLNAAFAAGFALLGPIVVTLFGAPALILIVAACYLVAAVFCWTLPSAPPTRQANHRVVAVVGETEQAVGSTLAQLREGIGFIRANPKISWSLVYLGIAASLVGVLGVIGPKFATQSLGLDPKDFVVVVLPLGFGIVTGILLLNNFGHLAPRRRIIEAGLVSLGILLGLLASAGPISRFLQGAETRTGLSALTDLTSLLGIVVAIALAAGIAYACVAIPSQTQLQEDIPEETRGRVFGVLNMLVSTASLLPLVVAGPLLDLVGTTAVLVAIAIAITASGIVSIISRGPLRPSEVRAAASSVIGAGLDPVAIAAAAEVDAAGRRHRIATAGPEVEPGEVGTKPE